MRFITVKITRDTNHSHVDEVAPWEIPILELVHNPGNVVQQGEKTYPERDFPAAQEEYDRLQSRYNADVKLGPYVAQVYGPQPAGVRALEAEIQKERDRVPTPTTAPAGADDLAA